ncbi:YesL family protein [Lederbergia citrea]|uniref:YesL family protein n=1 Tax=Lederbergia citrea TaxID=2833581 RepID=A0A942Z5D4_9BACI|nr:YesL family protein [Lederbergia citrea]MBS4178215.1 YesL family protein [Lederbergia citrea]MBS4223257.1 YesL family protein [Lederbergia citrea]
MDGKQIVTSLDRILHWIIRLGVLSGLWFLFSFLGVLVAGVFPATVAALGVSREWVKGNYEIHIWQTYKKIYRQEFVGANILGWILSIGGALLYINYRVMANTADEILFIIPFAFYLILFFYSIIVLWSFPLLAHYQAPWYQHIKNAFIIGISKIHYSIFIGMVIFIVIYISLELPAFIPFFSISIATTGCMWFSMQVFKKVDDRLS